MHCMWKCGSVEIGKLKNKKEIREQFIEKKIIIIIKQTKGGTSGWRLIKVALNIINVDY